MKRDDLDRAAKSVEGQTPAPQWLVSPESFASPRGGRVPDIGWYLPTWTERLRLMGWRNLLWIGPVVIAGLLAVLGPWVLTSAFWWGWWKLIVTLVVLPFSIALAQSRHILRKREDPFCIHCGYSAIGLPDGHACPECGEPFSHAQCAEYRRDPHWYIERHRRAHIVPAPDVPFEAGKNRRENPDGL
ncbi:MAG: hypothetical protein QM770_19260 [Tepidisphaeraceae bacterium]